MNKKLLTLLATCLMATGCVFDSVGTSSSSTTSSNNSFTINSFTSSSSSSSSSIKDETISISEAIKIAEEAGEEGTTIEYQVRGIIKEVSNFTYGEMTIEDSTGSLFVYGVYGSDRETRYDALEDRPESGDEITLVGKLKTFKGTPEMDRGYIVSFKHNDVSDTVDLTQYKEKTISEVREINEGSKVKVSGVVSKITYAFGMEPNGFYLNDNEASIYVYDTQFTNKLKIGNRVTIVGEKDYYVLGTEQTYADKYGYKGCCQISSAYLLENDEKINEFDLSWCEEKTIKDILTTPVSENITTNIYKVNALVSREEGKEFVNYYFYDLDGKTGSYTYTQCNGNDFEYLKEFDGKICTVYLSPINCKSTDTGCFYRFVPINVSYDNYEFDLSKAPSFALEYYAVDQFMETYNADPALEVVSSVSSELLGFENVTISYSSNNTEVAYFEKVEGKTIFHTGSKGEATIEITATYGDYEVSEDIVVKVEELEEIEFVDVKGAISASDSDEVTVKGVIASSLVNKQGFYLVDDTGLIAVEVNDSSMLKEVNVGNEVIVKGVKEHQKKEGKTNIGQAVVAKAELVVNLYGDNEYSTATFEDISFDDLYALTGDVNTDNTSKGYRVKARIVKDSAIYYTNFKLGNGSKTINFYAGNGETQYGYLLNDLVNQEVTVEVAICNWNSSDYCALTIIAVVTETGKLVNTCNWN